MRDLKNYNSFGGQSRLVSSASNPRAKKIKRIIYLQTFIAERKRRKSEQIQSICLILFIKKLARLRS